MRRSGAVLYHALARPPNSPRFARRCPCSWARPACATPWQRRPASPRFVRRCSCSWAWPACATRWQRPPPDPGVFRRACGSAAVPCHSLAAPPGLTSVCSPQRAARGGRPVPPVGSAPPPDLGVFARHAARGGRPVPSGSAPLATGDPVWVGERPGAAHRQAGSAAASATAAPRAILSSAPAASTSTVSPSVKRPSRMAMASGSWSRRWITRLSGRAPYVGS